MRFVFCVACALLMVGCISSDKPSLVPGRHWHRSALGERYLVENTTGHVEYWMFLNSAGSCTAQSLDDPLAFTTYFLTCDDAVIAIEERGTK